MTYGRHLEQRKFGVYYFRQTTKIDGKQVVRRFSLKTKNLAVAKFLSIQFLAKIQMNEINPDGIRKYDIVFDENNNIKSVSVKDDADARNLQDFLRLTELHKAEAHKRELDKLHFQSDLEEKEKQKFADSPEGKAKLSFREKLERELEEKESGDGKSLTTIKKDYLSTLKKVGPGTLYKYDSFITKFVDFAKKNRVHTVDKLDRQLVWAYRLHLENVEKKEHSTIKNVFSTLSTFYNYLLRSGQTKELNPFHGQNLEASTGGREPFTLVELEKIFSCDEVKANKQLSYILMLLLTTGARPNEICQLWKDDITDEGNGLITIRINENKSRGQKVKTLAAERMLYLNSLLVTAGFLEYIKTKKMGMIFDLKMPTLKNYSSFISLEFTAILRELKIETKTMYCFRHTALNALKQHTISPTYIQDMAGHEATTTAGKFYHQTHSPLDLKKETEKILSFESVKSLHNLS